jgi:hypothetical protein
MVRKTMIDTGVFVAGESPESGAKVPRMILFSISVITVLTASLYKS